MCNNYYNNVGDNDYGRTMSWCFHLCCLSSLDHSLTIYESAENLQLQSMKLFLLCKGSTISFVSLFSESLTIESKTACDVSSSAYKIKTCY